MTAIQSEALMCGMKEYSVSIKKQSTEVRVFVHKHTAVLTFYITGRVVVKNIMYQKKHDDTILLDQVDEDFVNGKCTVADLMSRYVYEVFNVALELRQRWRNEYRDRYNERIAAVATAVNNHTEKHLSSDMGKISDDLKDEDYSEVLDDKYLEEFYDEF